LSAESVNPQQLAAFLSACRTIVGDQWVLLSDKDRAAYADAFSIHENDPHQAAAIIAPNDIDELQAVVIKANELKVPIWPISRGKNLGYGGSAPVLGGSVIVDLTRMNRILEVDEKYAYCLLEPGVGFFDLYDYLKQNDIKLWMSVPGLALGSVMGNALERGAGPQPYGDHAAQICGMEVMLANGDIVRTGTGAMAGSQTWQTEKFGYGPSWDGLFCQSNFAIVTKIGMWLMPEPEATLSAVLSFPEETDLARAVDALYPLKQQGLIEHNIAILSYVGLASYAAPRSKWYGGEGVMPADIGAQVRKDLGLGWWTSFLTLYGYPEVIEAQAKKIQSMLKDEVADLQFMRWNKGDPIERSGAGVPSTRDMQMINWRGGRGGHLGFSPLLPADGGKAYQQYQRARDRFEAAGLDYYGAFAIRDRSIININEILYNRDDKPMCAAVKQLFPQLISDAAELGYSEYRTHIDYMDSVAATFDFNQHAMGRLNQTVKDALDPNGILAPGKQGIWPARYREHKS
jgi:4-cresol dehydrogenase (hydroxylating)